MILNEYAKGFIMVYHFFGTKLLEIVEALPIFGLTASRNAVYDLTKNKK
jgi:hypothetical protein